MLEWWREAYGPELMTWTELRNWAELSGAKPTPDEFRLIMELDRTHKETLRGGRDSKT